MGSAMGCCGKSDEDANNMSIGATLGGRDFQSGDKFKRIVKIQAAIRGYLTRKRIRGLKDQDGFKSMMNNFNFSGPANYDNPEV